nr:hypothetical protein [Brevibacillus laterosporus]
MQTKKVTNKAGCWSLPGDDRRRCKVEWFLPDNITITTTYAINQLKNQ